MEDASALLARRSAGLTFDDLPAAVVDTAKRGILDTLGVSVAATATSADYLDPVRAVLRSTPDGPVPAPTLGRGLPALDAMFWLGSLAHVLDFDDLAGYSHPSGPVVSAAVPLAHADAVDGRRLLTAVALGQDLVVRLAHALARPINDHGWMPSLPGVLAAALTTAHLRGLDAERTRAALGLAVHQTSGTMLALARPGSAYRAVREGLNARAGAQVALLAAEGMPGDADGLEGPFGYFPQFFGGEYDAEFLRTPDLLGPRIAFKAWPCAGHPQLYLTALARLRERGEVDVDRVSRVWLSGCSGLLPHQCAPLDERAAPARSIDAKISIPFLMGKLLRHGTLTVADFTPEGLRDPAAIALAHRVEWTLDPSLERGPDGFGVGIVEVEHTDGRRVRAEVEQPLGHSTNPLSWEEIVEKFRACVAAAAVPVPPEAAEATVAAVEELETLPDVRVLLAGLTAGP